MAQAAKSNRATGALAPLQALSAADRDESQNFLVLRRRFTIGPASQRPTKSLTPTVALYRNFPISTLLLWQSSEYAKGRRANPKAGQGA